MHWPSTHASASGNSSQQIRQSRAHVLRQVSRITLNTWIAQLHSQLVSHCGIALARAANVKEIVITENFIAREDCVKFLQNLLHFIGLWLHIQHSLYTFIVLGQHATLWTLDIPYEICQGEFVHQWHDIPCEDIKPCLLSWCNKLFQWRTVALTTERRVSVYKSKAQMSSSL